MLRVAAFIVLFCLLLMANGGVAFAGPGHSQVLHRQASPKRRSPLLAANHNQADCVCSGGLLRSTMRAYSGLLGSHPYSTKMATSAAVAGLGDAFVQLYSQHSQQAPLHLDLRRLLVFMVVASAYIAPITHLWFDYLDRMPMLKGLGKWSKSFGMIAVDQTVGALVISAAFFYVFELVQRILPPTADPFNLTAALLAGTEANQRHLWATLVANWYCWPFINFVNFHWVPAQYRVLFANVAAVFWNMFLSNIANSKR